MSGPMPTAGKARDAPESGEIHRDLTSIFRAVFRRADLMPTPEMTARDVAGWDRFRQVEIIRAVEEKHGFQFRARELDNPRDVAALARAVLARTAPNAAARRVEGD